MAGIKRITAETGEELGRGFILEDAAPGGDVVEGESGGTVDGGEEAGIRSGLDPTEILDAGFGSGISFEPEDRRSGAEIEKTDATLTVGGGEEEVGGGRFSGEEVAAEGERGPADGGNEWGERIGRSGRRNREGEGRNKLERARVEDRNGAAGGKGEEAGGAEVRGSEVIAARRARQHGVPRVLG